jgi:rod shape-determining protein MreD
MTPAAPKPFAEPIPLGRARAIPWVSVMAASALATAPVVAVLPLMPPPGLLMLLAWRLLARYAIRPWAAAPLGFWDDLVSGQPLGSAVLLWSLVFLAIEAVEQRMVFRDFRVDWLIAAAAIAFCLITGRLIAVRIDAPLWPLLSVQIIATILAFPFAARVVAWIDRKRGIA